MNDQDELELECTCPIGEEDPNCPEHQRLRELFPEDEAADASLPP